MKLFSRIKKRISDQKGESLAETLIAMLISVLGLLLLAMMITSSSKIITNSKNTMSEYTAAENNLVNKTGDPSSYTATITLKETSTSSQPLASSEVDVSAYKNERLNPVVIAYYK